MAKGIVRLMTSQNISENVFDNLCLFIYLIGISDLRSTSQRMQKD